MSPGRKEHGTLEVSIRRLSSFSFLLLAPRISGTGTNRGAASDGHDCVRFENEKIAKLPLTTFGSCVATWQFKGGAAPTHHDAMGGLPQAPSVLERGTGPYMYIEYE